MIVLLPGPVIIKVVDMPKTYSIHFECLLGELKPGTHEHDKQTIGAGTDAFWHLLWGSDPLIRSFAG